MIHLVPFEGQGSFDLGGCLERLFKAPHRILDGPVADFEIALKAWSSRP
jgi:hypothetical protein